MKNNNELIIKSNTLIEGLTDMKTIQYKFTLYLISLINKDDKEFKKVSIPTVKYAELLDIDAQKVGSWSSRIHEVLSKVENKDANKKNRMLSTGNSGPLSAGGADGTVTTPGDTAPTP